MYYRKGNRKSERNEQGEVLRVRLPRGREVLGILESRLGACRMMVKCLDGKSRVCRIPGRLKRALWIREGDVILVEPWEFEADSKGDIMFKYSLSAIEWLKKKGFLKMSEDEF